MATFPLEIDVGPIDRTGRPQIPLQGISGTCKTERPLTLESHVFRFNKSALPFKTLACLKGFTCPSFTWQMLSTLLKNQIQSL
jgi:hypothetical protein